MDGNSEEGIYLKEKIKEWEREIEIYNKYNHKDLFNSRIYKCIVWKEKLDREIKQEDVEKFQHLTGIVQHMFTFFETRVMSSNVSRITYEEFQVVYNSEEKFKEWLDKKIMNKNNLYKRINCLDVPEQLKDVLHDIRRERNVFTHDYIRMIVYPTLINFKSTNSKLVEYIELYQEFIFAIIPSALKNIDEIKENHVYWNGLKSLYYNPNPVILKMKRLNSNLMMDTYQKELDDPTKGNW